MGTLSNVEIFAVGTWNKMKFSTEDLIEIADNTSNLLMKSEHKPPLKLGHSNNQILQGQTDGDPAMGWVESVRISEDGKKLLANFVGIPDIITEAISKGRYKQVSVELKHIDHTGWILSAVALLGADLPAVKTLEDLQAFLSECSNPALSEVSFQFSEPVIDGPKQTTPEKDKTMSDVNAEFAEKEKLLMSQLEELKAQNEKLMSEKTEQLFSSKVAEVIKPFSEDVKDGKLTPAVFEELKAEVESNKKQFSETGKIVIDSDFLQKLVSGYKETGMFSETATNETKEDIEIDELIERKIADVRVKTGLNYSDAMHRVFDAEPALAEEYKQFTLKIHNGVE